jgi:hypothetical protein
MEADAREEILQLLEVQSGILSRRQCLESGLKDHDIRRMLRRRDLVLVHEGVYVNHTGGLTWLQRSWAAVHALWPAALCHESAIRAGDGPGRSQHSDEAPIHVAVDRNRAIKAPPGVVLHRIADFEAKVHANTSPPRQRIEEAVIDVAAKAANELDAVAALADAVRARRTTADRMRAALARRTRIRRRAFLSSVLDDVAAGTCSTLEHGYLDRVERAHGLPVAARQVKASSRGVIYRDVDYEAFTFRVELDGRVHHSSVRDRDMDLDRDLDAVADDQAVTVRLGWGQVFARPCRTAQRISTILVARGWRGTAERCPACDDSGGWLAPGDIDPPLSA